MDIAPHMSPDGVPENLWLQVSGTAFDPSECDDVTSPAILRFGPQSLSLPFSSHHASKGHFNNAHLEQI